LKGINPLGQHTRWQAILAITGIAMTMAFLGFLSFSRTTVSVPDLGAAYSEGIAGTPQFINPLLAQYNQVDQDLTALIFNGLTRSDGKGGLEADLAKSWQVSDDGLVYLFKLRQDIRWHDNEPFTADDVIFTINLMKDPAFPGVPYLGSLWRSVTVEKIDDYSIRLILPEPFPQFADFTTIGILPQHLLKDMTVGDLLSHPFNLHPVGTGPYRLDQVNAELAQLSANPLYTGPPPKLSKLEFKFYPNYQETIAAYQAKEVLGISYIPPQEIPTVKNLETLNLYSARLSGYDIVYLNLQAPETAPFFQEVEVRQALMYALNRQAIIDKVLHGQGLIANGPIRSWSWAYNADQPALDFDPAQAKTLLDTAGWIDHDGDGVRDKDGQPFAFEILVGDDPDSIAVAEAISQQWQQVGLKATAKVVGAALGEQLAQHNFQAALARVMLAGDPDPYPLWHQSQIEGGQNFAGWNNEEASILLEAGRTTTDKGLRNDYYFEFQRIFAQEVPSLILFHPVYTYGVSKDVFDVQLAPMDDPRDRFLSLPQWYMLTRQVIYKETQFEKMAP
jgi:peptide/nickel transport system substrate-binding protein